MIGERIRTLREQNNLTQTTLAKKLGLSRSAVNAWEMGVSIPSTQYLVELARLFNVSTDFILCIKHNEKEQLDIGNLNDEQKESLRSLLNQFRKHNDAVELLYENHLIQSGDEIYDTDFNIPKVAQRNGRTNRNGK